MRVISSPSGSGGAFIVQPPRPATRSRPGTGRSSSVGVRMRRTSSPHDAARRAHPPQLGASLRSSRGGETGRRTGLKIPSPARGVWVRFPPPAPTRRWRVGRRWPCLARRLRLRLGVRVNPHPRHVSTRCLLIAPVLSSARRLRLRLGVRGRAGLDDAALLRRGAPAHRGRVQRAVSPDGPRVLPCGVHVQRMQHRRSATRLTERRTGPSSLAFDQVSAQVRETAHGGAGVL